MPPCSIPLAISSAMVLSSDSGISLFLHLLDLLDRDLDLLHVIEPLKRLRWFQLPIARNSNRKVYQLERLPRHGIHDVRKANVTMKNSALGKVFPQPVKPTN